MASTRQTKLRIAASVIFASGFWDALAGRFLYHSDAQFCPPADNAPEWNWEDWRGALHVHSTYSDGAGDIPTVMAAAAAAEVDFLLLCDHNTQRPLRDDWESRYANRPLLLIGTEVTVEHGAFLLALEMPPEWEPTKGLPARATIDEVISQGGLPLVSLPFDVKHPWRDWDATGCEGLEVINFSTVARRHINVMSLIWLLPIYLLRGMLSVLRALVTRPDQAIDRWDSMTSVASEGHSTTRSVGIGALDAHALMKIGPRKYPIPSYEDSFRAVTTHVLLQAGATRNARPAIYEALREGRCFFSYDCLGNPAGSSFYAEVGGAAVAIMGERVTRRRSEPLTLVANTEPGLFLRVYRDGRIVAAGRNGHVRYVVDGPGVYRLEGYKYAVRVGGLYVGVRPYLFTNPIYVD